MMVQRQLTVIALLALCAVPMRASTASAASSSAIDLRTIGRVIRSQADTVGLGTAFVAGQSRSLYTCSHIVLQDTLWYRGLGSQFIYRVMLQHNLPAFDIAVLRRTAGQQPAALEFGDFTRVQPGDSIRYVGWDVRDHSFVIWSARVSAKGSALMPSGTAVDFIEFEGNAIPGYSGGPVLDSQGKVIAMLREAWHKQGVKGGPVVTVNRAFSTELLRVLDSEVTPHSGDARASGHGSLMDLLLR
jgi:S1-C subfamily serine protease